VRALVRLGESWAARGDLSPAARLALAEAYLSLGLLDRSWSRVEPLLAADPEAAAVALAGRVLVERGEFARARSELQKALQRAPQDRRLQQAWVDATTTREPPRPPDPDKAPLEELVTQARRWMGQSSWVRARSMLERARRRFGDSAQIMDLLWALDGDFSTQEPLLEQWRRLAPPVPRLMPDLPEPTEEPEFTENASRRDISALLRDDPPDPRAGTPFSGLFRGLQVVPAPDAAAPAREVTEVSPRVQPLEPGPFHDFLEPTSGGDTQIRRIIRSAEDGEEPTDGDSHDEPAPPPPTLADDDDDDRIQRRRRGSANAPEETTDVDLELDQEDEPGSGPLPEDAAWAHPGAAPASPPTKSPAPPKPNRSNQRLARWVVLVALGLIAAVAAFLLALLLFSRLLYGLL
jgi:tetratricopeptide (TPR) repeat protein